MGTNDTALKLTGETGVMKDEGRIEYQLYGEDANHSVDC